MSGDRTTAESPGARHFAAHLLPSEWVVAAERRHWARLIGPVSTVVLGLVVLIWLDIRLPQNVPALHNLFLILWLAACVRLLYKYVEWRSDWFVATNKRVILAYGVFTRRVAMMPLLKVTDMSYNRSVLGRLLGYGEFVLESAGQDQALRTVSFLPHPDALYEEICLEIFGSTTTAAPPAPPARPTGGPGSRSGGRTGGRTGGRGSTPPAPPPPPAAPNAVTTIVPFPVDPADD